MLSVIRAEGRSPFISGQTVKEATESREQVTPPPLASPQVTGPTSPEVLRRLGLEQRSEFCPQGADIPFSILSKSKEVSLDFIKISVFYTKQVSNPRLALKDMSNVNFFFPPIKRTSTTRNTLWKEDQMNRRDLSEGQAQSRRLVAAGGLCWREQTKPWDLGLSSWDRSQTEGETKRSLLLMVM